MKISEKAYIEVIENQSNQEYLLKIATELADVFKANSIILMNLVEGMIINPNMYKGMLVMWKMCSLTLEEKELERTRKDA